MLKNWQVVRIAAAVGFGLMGLAGGVVVAGEEITIDGGATIDQVEKQFRELPMEARRLTGPLFWLHGDESKDRLELYVGKVAEGGNGCFTAESRPHADWLGAGWFRDLGICLEAAKKHGLKMWIFDEKWWPSGEVGRKVPAQYGSKRLSAAVSEVKGPGVFTGAGYGGAGFIAAVAGRETADGIDAKSLVDLAGSIRDGELKWDAPAGEWKVMKFTWAAVPVGGRYLVDGASRDCADWYIRTVYQPHYDHFKSDFGKNILGFFYDEPETHGDWGSEVMKVLAERGVDWKKALVAFKFKLAGEEQVAARYQYLDAFAEAWGRTLYGGVTRWCHEHGVKSMGHFLEHAQLYANLNLCAGDMFQLQKYSDMGAIDAVFSQFKMGQRAAYDAPCWQTPKIASSISHVYGKPDDVAMVEIFGARGQDLTYPEMKWWADHMQVSGVNFLIPHSFNPRAPRDTDCPPYFYDGGFEPRYPLYRVFADYTSRLSVMLTGGRHVCPVALLYLGQSANVGKRVLPDQISEALQDALYDCDWMPYEVFEQDTKLDGRQVRMRDVGQPRNTKETPGTHETALSAEAAEHAETAERNTEPGSSAGRDGAPGPGSEAYRVLIVPPAEVMPYATLAKAAEFFDRGGVVVGYGFLPDKSATLGKTAADIGRLREHIWGAVSPGVAVCKTSAAGGRSYLLPEQPTPEQIQQVLAGDAGVHPTLEVVEGRTDHWLHVLHRVKAGRDVFFVTNQNHTGEARRFRFRITAGGEPECWDAMRNEITAVACTRTGEQVEVSLTLEPLESVLLVFQAQKRALPMRLEAGTKAVASIPVVREAAAARLEPVVDSSLDPGQTLEDCSWVWYPEGNPAVTAPAGKVFFRKRIEIPAGRRIKEATFTGAADNAFVLYVNGKEAGRSDDSGEGWRNPVRLPVGGLLKAGVNQLAIVAENAASAPAGANPAGVIGRLVVAFEPGAPMTVRVDGSWKASREAAGEWMQREFDEKGWVSAKEVARFGDRPWGRLQGQLTLSPVKADPFVGRCEIPATAGLAGSRVYLEMDSISPEAAARVTVNGHDVGGVVGKPLRLEITPFVKTGVNTIRVEPFAPAGARVVVYAR